METLFRFSLKRPAVEQSEEFPSIALEATGELADALTASASSADPRGVMKAAARRFVASDEFVPDIDTLAQGAQLKALRQLFTELLQAGKPMDHDALHWKIHEAMQVPNDQYILNDTWYRDQQRLHNSILAIKWLPEEHHRPLHRLVRVARDKATVVTSIEQDGFPPSLAVFKRHLERSLALPGVPAVAPVLAEEPDDRGNGDEEDASRRRRLEELLKEFRDTTVALEEITHLGSDALSEDAGEESSELLLDSRYRPTSLFTRSLDEKGDLSPVLGRQPLNLARSEMSAERFVVEPPPPEHETPVLTRQAAMTVSAGTRTLLTGRIALAAQSLLRNAQRITQTGQQQLSDSSIQVLKNAGIELAQVPLEELTHRLEHRLEQQIRQMDALSGRPQEISFKRFGHTLVRINTPIATPWARLALGISPQFLPELAPITGGIPDSHGDIAPAGISDLLLVKQQLKGYEPTDIAHIENVLQGESKKREHRRRRETEELRFFETETTTTDERELESTERFEMQRETEETVKNEASIKAGLTVSGKYGPTVEFSANTEGSLSRSREEAVRSASSYSREITERSALKVTERVLQRESLKVTTEVEELNRHQIDNSEGDGHISGIYQWLNKVYEAQVFNYGLRTLYDFMVAEPGAFLMESLRRSHANAMELEKPQPFTLQANQLSTVNYHYWVNQYGATDVMPPPPVFRTKAHDFNIGEGDDKTNYTHSTQIGIDEGYEAYYATVAAIRTIWDDNASLDVAIGRRVRRMHSGEWLWTVNLDSIQGSVALALVTWRIADLGVAVEIHCRRTDHALDRWRQDTHAKLTQAYRVRLAEYEEKLAALEAQAGIEIEGRNPQANEELMNDEIKKACISILTAQHYTLFNAIENGSNGLPQINLSENALEGPYVRFFEQAFEWQHMTWISYPYFWGRKSQWTRRLTIEDQDPLFERFMKAGYCRATVPIRPGFENAVDHFMTFGELWNGGPLPPISHDLYLPIADELAEQLERPGAEVPQGEPWEVRIPTNLVKLRQSQRLPTWSQDEDGQWRPDPTPAD